MKIRQRARATRRLTSGLGRTICADAWALKHTSSVMNVSHL